MNNFTQKHIDLVAAQILGGMANIQEIYPLGPLQKGILFHHMLSSPEEGDTYISPYPVDFNNREQLDNWLKALPKVVARHDILHTAIFWKGLPQAVQVVLRKADLVIQDISVDLSVDIVTQVCERTQPTNL